MYTRELIETQHLLEEEMRGAAISRFHTRHNKALEKKFFGETAAGMTILKQIVQPFADAINAWTDEALTGATGRRSTAALLVREFDDTDAIAYIFAKSVINAVPMLQNKAGTASRTGVVLTSTNAIHDELRLRWFNKNHNLIFRRIMKDCDTRNLVRQRRKELYKKEFTRRQIEWVADNWHTKNRVHLGMRLLEIFKEVTGMIKFSEVRMSNGKRRAIVEATPEMIEMLKDRLERCEHMFPIFYPMVVKPNPWTNDMLVGSSYLTNNVQPYKLIKRAKMNYLRELENTDISVTLNAVNALQETPWRVNTEMLEALRWVYDNSLQVDKLPPADDLPLPPMPPKIDDDKVRKQNAAACAHVHNQNRKFVSKRLALLQVMQLADKFKDFEELFFPHDLCSRGRAYPKPHFLNPQGPAYVRSLAVSVGLLIYFASLGALPVAQAGAGLFSAPLWVALLTVFLFRQFLGFAGVFAVLLGFVGALMLLQPDFQTLTVLSFMPLAAGFFYGLGMMLTRHWCVDESPVTLAIGIFLTIGLAGLFMLGVVTIWPGEAFISAPWVTPSARFLWLTLFQAVGAVIAVTLIAQAYRIGTPAVVAVFEYSFLVFASLWAFLLWGTATNLLAGVGITVIVISGLLMAMNQKRTKDAFAAI